MVKQYKVSLIGVGGIASHHQEQLVSVPDRCEIVGIFDIDSDMLEKRHKEWKYPSFSSLDALLKEQPDVCWVMTPPKPRIKIFKKCFAAGCHIFTEKPLALNNEDAETCVRMAQEAGKILGFGCNERNVPSSYTMGRIFFSGVLGRLIKVYAQTYIRRTDEFWTKKYQQPDAWRLTFDSCGGRIFEYSIHLVNWVQWIGGAPEFVVGTNDAISKTLAANGLDDVVSALIKFADGYGVVETIMSPGQRRPIRRDMGIVGTKGECWYDEDEKKVRVVVPSENRDEFIEPEKCPTKAEEMFNAIDEGRTPSNDGAAALATTRICCAFNESVQKRETIFLK